MSSGLCHAFDRSTVVKGVVVSRHVYSTISDTDLYQTTFSWDLDKATTSDSSVATCVAFDSEDTLVMVWYSTYDHNQEFISPTLTYSVDINQQVVVKAGGYNTPNPIVTGETAVLIKSDQNWQRINVTFHDLC
jgi:hypothetical protein